MASNALWHMGKPNPITYTSMWTEPLRSGMSVDGIPHHLCLLRSSLPLCFTFCHLECQPNQLISPGFHFSEEQKDPLLAWQPSRNAALIPPADTASSHEKSPAQRACVFVHTPCLFLLHNSSAAQAGQSLRGPIVRTFL